MNNLPNDIIFYLMDFGVYNLLIRTCKKIKKIGETRYLLKLSQRYPTFRESKYIIQNILESYGCTYVYFVDIKNNIEYRNTLTNYDIRYIDNPKYVSFGNFDYKSRKVYIKKLFDNTNIKMLPKLYFEIMKNRISVLKFNNHYNYSMTVNYINNNFLNCSSALLQLLCQDSHSYIYSNNGILQYNINLLIDKYKFPNPPKLDPIGIKIKKFKNKRPAAIDAEKKIKELNKKLYPKSHNDILYGHKESNNRDTNTNTNTYTETEIEFNKSFKKRPAAINADKKIKELNKK